MVRACDVLFPALRLGYVVVPADLVDIFAAAESVSTHQPPLVNQAILADFMNQGHFARHVRRMRERKRSALLSGPQHRISAPAATRTPYRRKPALEDELSEIGSLDKWPSLRHANDNKRRL